MGLAYRCRAPNLGDFLAFYSADFASASLQDYATKELEKRNPDGWGLLLSFGASIFTEAIKAGVNQQLCSPFRSITESRPPTNQRKRRARLRYA